MKHTLYRLFTLLILLVGIPCRSPADGPYFVDLSPVANTSPVNDGNHGWSEEGINDMEIYPPIPSGIIERNGYRFRMADKTDNGGKTILMLKGRYLAEKPREATLRLSADGVKGKFVYFLQNAVRNVAGQAEGYLAAVYTVHYADGSKVEVPIRHGVEIRHWWTGQWFDNSGAKSWPIFMGRNAVSSRWNQWVGVWAMQWANPWPEKPIIAFTFRSEGHAAAAIFAVTVADEDFHASPNVKQHFRRPDDVPVDHFAAKRAVEQRDLYAAMRVNGMAKGMRQVELIRPDLIAVTLDASVAQGEGMNRARAAALETPNAFGLRSNRDPNYRSARTPIRVTRLSYEYWNGDVGRFPQRILYWHTYHLFLPHPLKGGNEYLVSVNGLSDVSIDRLTFAYDPKTTVTPAIKVNQAAYSSAAQRRYAYLGWWAAEAGKVDYSAFRDFEVVNEKNNRIALKGRTASRDPDDRLSGESVYEMDLSALKPGQYHIRVAELGRSDSFGVGGKAIGRLYYDTARAFFHQRCGQEMRAPFSDFRKPACHTEVYENGHLAVPLNPLDPVRADESMDQAKRSFRGGYHDAADFDVFAYHLRATAQMMTAYELAPERFTDGSLNLPESGNGIPDLLDEAEWALFSYLEAQSPEGAIPLGRGNDEDAIRDWERDHGGRRPPFGVFPPTAASSAEYAAVAAQFSRLIQPYDRIKSKRYIESARKALDWARSHPDTAPAQSGSDLFLTWAAAEVYAATGDETVHDFFKKQYAAGATKKIDWKLAQAFPICVWSYITCKQPGVDETIRKEMRDALIVSADTIVRETEKPAYRVGRGPAETGNGWGNLNGGGRWADPCLRAYLLTKEPKYLTAASLNADFQLGANPLSKTFITGVGARSPLHPQISAFLYTGTGKTGKTVRGITVYGLASAEPSWYPSIPSWRRWRDLGNGGAEVSSEFTITETIGASAMLYAMLYALEPQ